MKTNHLAVWATIILNQFMGYVWYSPALFLHPWLSGQGRTMQQLEAGSWEPIALALMTSILTAYFLAWLIARLDVRGFVAGAKLGLILFVGLVLFSLAAHYQFLGVSNRVMWIDLGQVLFYLILAAGILAAWRPSR